MIFIGIDPGKKGAIAIIKVENNSIFNIVIYSCPVINVGKGKKVKMEYLVSDMVEIINYAGLYIVDTKDIFCIIEKVHAMPKQGVSSMFSMGIGFGLWQGILTALSIPYELVTSQRWKKEMLKDMPGDNQKAKSIIAAKRLFPNVSLKRTDRSRKDDDGLAEALLLAEYARRNFGKGN